MAITIDWLTKVIDVPKADLSLIQASPEIRELDLDWFRLTLKDIEDSIEGMPNLDTHRHNTEVSLAGLTYARTVEIINGYTVEFEDGQYTINCTGANHNVSDVKVANQVSLIVNNAAGLITNPAIEYSSFNGGVTIDVSSAYTGTVFPTGTPQRPVNNLADAKLIAEYRGFDRFYIQGNITLATGDNISDYSIYGQSHAKTTITLGSAADIASVELYDATVTGILDGSTVVRNCYVTGLNYVDGMVIECVLEGTTSLSGSEAYFINCWSGLPDQGGEPEIDMNGGGTNLNIKQHSGYVKIKNSTSHDQIHVDLISGTVELDSTLTDGQCVIRGVGRIVNNSTIASLDTEALISNEAIAYHVWDESLASHDTSGTAGDALSILRKLGTNRFLVDESVNKMYIYDDNGTTPILVFNLLDINGNPTYQSVMERTASVF